jgi:hypothetical protein
MRILLMATALSAYPHPSLSQRSLQGPERKAVLNAARTVLEKDLQQRVLFVVQSLRELNGWAFLTGRTVQPNGKPIDYRRTHYREAVDAEAFDDAVSVLLQKSKRGWQVKVFALGATDVPWVDWPRKFGAPKRLFPGLQAHLPNIRLEHTKK